MDEWLLKCMHDCKSESVTWWVTDFMQAKVMRWMTGHMVGWAKEWTNEWLSEWTNEWRTAWMDVWMNECMREKWRNKWMHEWMSDEWMSEWVNGRVSQQIPILNYFYSKLFLLHASSSASRIFSVHPSLSYLFSYFFSRSPFFLASSSLGG